MMETPLTKNIKPDREPLTLKEYEHAGGYQSVRKVLREMEPEAVTKLVKDSNLKGRGGAGFPTGMKWSFVPMGDAAPHPKYLIANADEMEPGTFKDRLLLEGDPHQLIEGMIASAYAIQADVAYIFLRSAYKLAAKRLERAIKEAYDANHLGRNICGSDYSLELYLHVSAGRYMCGEETGLLNALEGKRATPRSKPPFPAVSGLWGKPTIVNNVETLCNVPHIVNNGADWFKGLSITGEGRFQEEIRLCVRADWFKGLSITGDGGTKIYGVSGKVKRPGAWELPLGTTLREILEEHAGGMRDGLKCRGVIPGGASTDFLIEEHFDVQMDFEQVQKVGSRLGTGTMIVMDDQTCPVGLVLNLERFFAQESCGWCTPCREGLPWTAKILQAIDTGEGKMEDLEKLAQISKFLGPGNTFCALAPGAVEPLQSALKYFKEDFERHIREKRCPWK